MAGHGGARAGAGRKPKRIKYKEPVEATDAILAAHQEKAAANLIKLADGGYKRKTEVWKPAGLIQFVVTEKVETENGPKILRHLVPAFPDIPSNRLVCVERKFEIADADRAANQYILDRIGGKPGQMEDAPEENEGAAKANDENRRAAMEKMKLWREQSAQQLDSIRNPLTGATMVENESTSEQNTLHDSSTMEEF